MVLKGDLDSVSQHHYIIHSLVQIKPLFYYKIISM